MKRQTNIQFVTHLMDYARSGPLMQAFVLEALHDYSARVITQDNPGPENGFIAWPAWQACATEAMQALADRPT